MRRLKNVIQDRRGQDMIEYALMAASVAVAVAAFIPYSVLPALSTIWGRVSTVMFTLTGVGS